MLIIAGCSGPSDGPSRASTKTERNPNVRESKAYTLDDLDFGDDWLVAAGGEPAGDLATDAALVLETGPEPGVRKSFWSVLLRTFSGDEHRTPALNMAQSVGNIEPQLAEAYVHTTSKGSMVLYGTYDSADDPAAQRDLDWVKAINVRNRPVFPQAMLTRVNRSGIDQPLHPFDLMNARRKHPRIDPLYTLQVGVWGVFGNEKLKREDMVKRAMGHVAELRRLGYEAYVHHDDDRGISMVTIGLFDHTAVDAQSGIMAPEVEAILKKYPLHLVNGEPLSEPLNPRRPELGSRPQTPRLVLVPTL